MNAVVFRIALLYAACALLGCACASPKFHSVLKLLASVNDNSSSVGFCFLGTQP